MVQETDWIDRNPILHHRMLESLALAGDEVLVLDYDILWRRRGSRPLLQRRRVVRDVAKFHPGSGVVVVRPAMLRVPILARPTWLAMTVIELIRAFRAFKPDIVVAYGISNALVARLLSRWYRVPFVFHIFDALHGIAEPQFLAPIARVVERAVLRSARIVVVVHRALLGYVRRMGVAPSRVRFIMNGFEVREIAEEAATDVRHRLGIADDEVMVLFVGWLYTHSGLLEIAKALVGSDRHRGYRLVIAGDGDLFEELTAIVRDAEHGHRVVLLGRVPVRELPELIAASDVGLCASTQALAMRYVVPAKVDEYLEVGRPVVASRLPGMLEELANQPSVIWIDGPEAALDAVAAVVAGRSDPRAHLRELGAAAREYGRGRESWAIVTSRFRVVLEEARSSSGATSA